VAHTVRHSGTFVFFTKAKNIEREVGDCDAAKAARIMKSLRIVKMCQVSRRCGYRAIFIAFCLLLVGCANVKVIGQREIGKLPAVQPKVIYVADFALDTRTMLAESGVLPISPAAADESVSLPLRLMGVPIERAARAHELVNLMSSSLVEDLRSIGLNAYHLSANERLPTEGWLVSGVFVQMDEGNRLRRALIGFGSGGTTLQLTTSLSDLVNGIPRPFCELRTSTRSRNRPGAIISFDPYAVAARFVVCRLDLDTNVTDSAAKIATDIARRVQYHDCAT
jgi:hypothetical protein